MAGTNRYHILSFLPAVEAWEMAPEREAQVHRLVASGKLRIHTDSARNFVRFGTADTDATFTARELTDPALRRVTRAELARHVPGAMGDDGVEQLMTRLLDDLKHAGMIEPEKEMKVARVFVQAAHPAIIELLLQRGTAILVSYAHNVADLMPVHRWEDWGTSSGLQSTETRMSSVYVSCGGDPFFEGEHKHFTTDGFPALARMVVIAGQETCHFADLIHGRDGNIYGRHSTDNQSERLRAAPIVRDARRADMARVEELRRGLNRAGLPALRKAERACRFYRKRARFSPQHFFCQNWRSLMLALFALRNRTFPIRLHTYPKLYRGESLEYFIDDMAFNLAPDADVYRRPDPEEEEAIACIEAVARVPQQRNKWGPAAVAMAWPELNSFYETTILPATERAVGKAITVNNNDKIHRLNVWLRRHFRPRPGYWPDPADPV